jgi:hypothetical protein
MFRLLGRRVRADDGRDPTLGIPAERIEATRPTSDTYRITLLDAGGLALASFDMDRGDIHDLRHALTTVLRAR